MDVSDDKEEVDRSVVLVNVCRCCLNDGCYKDISTEYHWIGQTEIYEDMLKDTFDICISYHNGGGPSSGSRLICEDCISKLRDASEFKKKVLESENNFTNHLKALKKRNAIKNALELKEEEINNRVKEEYEENTHKTDDDHHDYDCGDNADFDDSEIIADIKLENNDDDSDFELTLESLRTKFKTKRKKSSKIKTKTRKKAKLEGEAELIETSTKKNNKVLVAPARLIEEKYEQATEITKPRMLKENTIKLINNSNIIIFGGTRKFKCLLCRANFACISNLRVHSVTKHRADEIANKILAQRLSSYFQTDITNLKCSQCSLPCETLEELKKHLVKCHDVKLFSIDSMLIPFRFSKDNILRCVICEEVFENFAKLSRHMTAHYGNFVCQTCGTAYYDNNRLQIHIKTNHRAVKCSICNMKFSTTQEKFKHRRNVHKIIEKRHCTCCPATFPNAYKLLRHMIEEHGKQKPELTCPFCDQKFILKGARSTHIKTVHQGVRTKSCDICSMKFYRNSDLIRHQTTHDSEKKYLCVICQTKFKSKDSLSRHLKNKLRCKGSNDKLLYSSQDGARIEDLLN